MKPSELPEMIWSSLSRAITASCLTVAVVLTLILALVLSLGLSALVALVGIYEWIQYGLDNKRRID